MACKMNMAVKGGGAGVCSVGTQFLGLADENMVCMKGADLLRVAANSIIESSTSLGGVSSDHLKAAIPLISASKSSVNMVDVADGVPMYPKGLPMLTENQNARV